MNDQDIKKAYVIGNVILKVFKWIFLIMMVISIGFTLGLTVFTVIYGNKVPIDLINKISYLFLSLSSEEVSDIITNYGMDRYLVALIGVGVARSLTRLMYYILVDRFITLYKSITVGDLFTRTSNKLVDEMMGVSILATFTLPLFVLVVKFVTSIDVEEYMNIGYGCLLLFALLFVLKIILNRGLDVTRESNKYNRMINDYRADIDELKIQSIRRDSELKKLKSMVKEQEEKEKNKNIKKKKKVKKTTTK